MDGYVYLLHLDRPISDRHTARHYIGFCSDLAARIQKHERGNGSRFMNVARERGIGFTVVRVWRGDRVFERWLKNKKNAPCLCPVCTKKPVQYTIFDLTPEQIVSELIPF